MSTCGDARDSLRPRRRWTNLRGSDERLGLGWATPHRRHLNSMSSDVTNLYAEVQQFYAMQMQRLDGVEVEDLRLQHLLPAERQELTGEHRGSLPGLAHLGD